MKILLKDISVGNYIFWNDGHQHVIAKVITGTIYRTDVLAVDGLILEDTRDVSYIGEILSFNISKCDFFTKRSDINKLLIFS